MASIKLALQQGKGLMIPRLRVLFLRQFSAQSSLERFSISIPKERRLIYKPKGNRPTDTFESLGMSQPLVELLKERNISLPTPIQRLSIPAVSNHRRLVIGGETGSGKTIAFLYPLMQEIKAAETRTSNEDSTKPGCPKGIVLVPTNELALQIKTEAKLMSKVLKLRIQALFQDMPTKHYKAVLSSPVEILLLTPSKLLMLIQKKRLQLQDLSHLVIDEGDSLLEQESNFGSDTMEILKIISVQDPKIEPKIIISCATITNSLRKNIIATEKMLHGDHFVFVLSPGLHKPPRGIRQQFIRISREGNEKQQKLLSIVKSSNKRERILIFCNRIASMEAIRTYFKSDGIMHYSWELEECKIKNVPLDKPPNQMYDCIHGYLTVAKRKQIIDAFNEGAFTILLASGLTGRGMDFNGGVELVVLYDLPKNPIDYLHRIGRSARAFAPGKAVIFVTKSTRLAAGEIQRFCRQNSRIHGALQATNRKPRSTMRRKIGILK